MVTTNVLQRTFHIFFGQSMGTAFTIDHDGRRYLITAKHVVKGIANGDQLLIANNGVRVPLPVKVVGHAADPIDISVLALPMKLGPDHSLPATSAGFTVGQEVFLVGFPFGLFTEAGHLNANFPIAFVKKGILSAFGRDGGQELYYLDAHNNPGFSGGPVVFRREKSPDLQVAGVITAYRFEEQPVYAAGQETNLVVRSNTGIVITWPIRYALDLIIANSIGTPV